jgi:hypothetical protein
MIDPVNADFDRWDAEQSYEEYIYELCVEYVAENLGDLIFDYDIDLSKYTDDQAVIDGDVEIPDSIKDALIEDIAEFDDVREIIEDNLEKQKESAMNDWDY